MAKAKLTRQSIIFLVSTYEDVTNTYTFADITKMIEAKFGIEVTAEAVRLSYHANKNPSLSEGDEDNKDKINDGNGFNPTLKTEAKRPSVSMSELRGIVKKNSTNQKEFDTSYKDISKEELDSLFTSSKDN